MSTIRAAMVACAVSLGACASSPPEAPTADVQIDTPRPAAVAAAPRPLPPTRPVVVLAAPLPVAPESWSPPVPEVDPCPSTVDGIVAGAGFDRDDARLHGRNVLVVAKTLRRLWLFDRGSRQGCWPVGLGFDPQGDKLREGDGRTPEGWYRTSDKPWSTFDGAIAIHYPNLGDAEAAEVGGRISTGTRKRIARALGRGDVPPQRTAMGGAVLIHGGGSGSDWTLGCVALDDEHLASLRAALPASKATDLLVLP